MLIKYILSKLTDAREKVLYNTLLNSYDKSIVIMYILGFLFDVFRFVLFSFLFFFLPGLSFLHLSKKLHNGEKNIVSWSVGIVLFLVTLYLLSWIHLPFLYFFAPFLSCVYLWKTQKKPVLSFEKKDIVTFLLILLGSICMVSYSLWSAWPDKQGVGYQGTITHDGMIHLAHIKTQMIHFPPQIPWFSNTSLRGYHYFFDFLLAQFCLLSGIQPEHMLFRLFPFFLALLFGGTIYVYTMRLVSKKEVAWGVLCLSFIGQTGAFLYWHESLSPDIGVPQTPALILDPSVILSVVLLLTGFLFLSFIREEKRFLLLSALTLGILAQVKVYAGVMGLGALACVFLMSLFKKERKEVSFLLGVGLLAAVVAAGTFLPNNFGSGGLVFAPFLFYAHYMQIPLYKSLSWEVTRQVYAQHHNIPRLFQLYLKAFGIFWAMNLGIKIVVLGKGYVLFSSSFWKDKVKTALFFAITIGILMGSFFVQTISPFDSAQFFWITIVLLSIPCGIVMTQLLLSLPKWAMVIMFLGIVSVSSHQVMDVFSQLSGEQRTFVTTKTHQLYKDIARHVPASSFLVGLETNNEVFPVTNIAAVTGRSVYYQSLFNLFHHEQEVARRKARIHALTIAIQDCDKEKILSLVQKIGSGYLVSETRRSCLQSWDKVVYGKEAKDMSFYILSLR